jgi:hypothetical protein
MTGSGSGTFSPDAAASGALAVKAGASGIGCGSEAAGGVTAFAAFRAASIFFAGAGGSFTGAAAISLAGTGVGAVASAGNPCPFAGMVVSGMVTPPPASSDPASGSLPHPQTEAEMMRSRAERNPVPVPIVTCWTMSHWEGWRNRGGSASALTPPLGRLIRHSAPKEPGACRLQMPCAGLPKAGIVTASTA